jgi:hypothetical protein
VLAELSVYALSEPSSMNASRTAKALSLDVPTKLLVLADE